MSRVWGRAVGQKALVTTGYITGCGCDQALIPAPTSVWQTQTACELWSGRKGTAQIGTGPVPGTDGE